MKITNTSQLGFLLKSKTIDVKNFDYVEGKTTEEFIADHPMIIHGRRFYENPYLWTMVMDAGIKEAVEYLYNNKELLKDTQLVKAALQVKNEKSKLPLKVLRTHLEYITSEEFKSLHKNDESTNLSEEEQEKNIEMIISSIVDEILTSLVAAKHIEWFKIAIEIANEFNIKPLDKTFANAGKGMALYYSTSEQYLSQPDRDTSFAFYLLENGANPSYMNSIAYWMACKYAAYSLARAMILKGANLHAQNDIGLKLIARNDKAEVKLSEEDEIARKILLDLYKEDKEKETVEEKKEE